MGAAGRRALPGDRLMVAAPDARTRASCRCAGWCPTSKRPSTPGPRPPGWGRSSGSTASPSTTAATVACPPSSRPRPPPSPTPATCRSSSSARRTTTPGVFRDVFPRGEYGLHHLARICHDYEAERDAYRGAGPRGRVRGNRRRQPHLLGRHVAHARLHGRAARAQRRAGRLVRPHAQGRRARGTAATASSAARLPIADGAMKGAELASTFPELLARTVAVAPRAPRADHRRRVRSPTTSSIAARREMAQALLARGAGKGTRIGLLAPDGVLWLTTFYAALRIGALVTPISTLATPPELAHIIRHERCPDPRRRPLASCGATSRDLLAAALPGLDDATSRRAAARRALPSSGRSGSTTPTGVPWARPVDELLARRAPRRRTTSLLAPSSWRCRRPTTRSSSTPRAAPRRRRRWCTASGPSPASPRSLALVLRDHRRRPHHAAAARRSGWAASPHALQVLSTGEHARVPAVTRRSTTCSTWSSGTTSPTSSSGTRCAEAARRGHRPRASTSTGSEGWAHRRGTQHGERIPTGRRANLLGMSESFAIHSAEPHRPPRCPRTRRARPVEPSTASSVGWSTRRPARRCRRGEVGELQLRGGALMTGFYKVARDEVFTADGFYPTERPRPHRRRRLRCTSSAAPAT